MRKSWKILTLLFVIGAALVFFRMFSKSSHQIEESDETSVPPPIAEEAATQRKTPASWESQNKAAPSLPKASNTNKASDPIAPSRKMQGSRERLEGLNDNLAVQRFLADATLGEDANNWPWGKFPQEDPKTAGHFSGTMKFSDPPDRVWKVVIDIPPIRGDGQLGLPNLSIIEEGKSVEGYSGKGKGIMIGTLGNSLGFVLQLSPTMDFQFFYAPKLNALIGTYYEIIPPNDGYHGAPFV